MQSRIFTLAIFMVLMSLGLKVHAQRNMERQREFINRTLMQSKKCSELNYEFFKKVDSNALAKKEIEKSIFYTKRSQTKLRLALANLGVILVAGALVSSGADESAVGIGAAVIVGGSIGYFYFLIGGMTDMKKSRKHMEAAFNHAGVEIPCNEKIMK